MQWACLRKSEDYGVEYIALGDASIIRHEVITSAVMLLSSRRNVNVTVCHIHRGGLWSFAREVEEVRGFDAPAAKKHRPGDQALLANATMGTYRSSAAVYMQLGPLAGYVLGAHLFQRYSSLAPAASFANIR